MLQKLQTPVERQFFASSGNSFVYHAETSAHTKNGTPAS
jgi:hypothetical protein